MNHPLLSLDPLAAQDALAQGAWLVDVREAHEVRRNGHRKVRNLAGGMAAWLAHGLPVRAS